jgi:DNA-binding NtrC family response regulator
VLGHHHAIAPRTDRAGVGRRAVPGRDRGDEPAGAGEVPAGPAPGPAGPASIPREGINLDAVEREMLEKAMAQANNNKSEAARLLGLARGQLYSRLKRYALTRAKR